MSILIQFPRLLHRSSLRFGDARTVQAKWQSTFTMKNKLIQEILKLPLDAPEAQKLTAHGWIRTVRQQKQLVFMELTDGSTMHHLQCILQPDRLVPELVTGASVRVVGTLVASPAKNQRVELVATDVEILGGCDVNYPVAKTGYNMDYLREHNHLRWRTRTFQAMVRIRDATVAGIHDFFRMHQFHQVQTPLITSNDCEGGGETFRVVADKPNFFGTEAHLTVSGQLHLEMVTASLARAYNMNPAFRAEVSDTSRHLAEFWMVEAEASFLDSVPDLLDLIEAFVKHVVGHVIVTCSEELDLFNRHVSKGVLQRIQALADKPFARITYTEAIDTLTSSASAGKEFEHVVEWGKPLQTEHERFLAENVFQHPVFVTDYPKDIKSFYMRINEDGKTVACTDLLLPHVGELVGGSLREERLTILEQRMADMNMEREPLEWYLDLRRFGTTPHGGFGLGLERLLLYMTGLTNVRDAILVPRWVNHCRY